MSCILQHLALSVRDMHLLQNDNMFLWKNDTILEDLIV